LSAHVALRAATSDAHDRVDHAFARYDLNRPGDYADFLTGHAAAFVPIEAALERGGAVRFLPDWNLSRRAPLLAADLADLGRAPPSPIEQPNYSSDAALLGALYVLEGSRLGGAMLRRTVPPEQPSRFLSAVHSAGRWRTLVATLDRNLDTSAMLKLATDSALQTFGSFERVAARSIA
jgi:heme oxygenase